MRNEDRIVELLTETLIKQDQMIDEFKGMNSKLKEMKGDISELKDQQNVTNVLLRQHSRDLMKIADLLEESYPKFNELVEIEIIDEGSKKGVIHKIS